MQNEQKQALFIGALGIVFGDIGTSPLYALRLTLHNLDVNPLNILGILSLIFWTFIFIISLKYVVLILRADNRGEGGILALFAILRQKRKRTTLTLLLFSIIGAGLLFSDGMLTPAVSVLSAIEGLNTLSSNFTHWVEPIAIAIIATLFIFQYKGTDSIGRLFGPILVVWFVVIGGLGLYRILENPLVMKAINPYYAWEFFSYHKLHSSLVLSGIFLVITGGEALYADLGHFGKRAIRQAWFFVVMPCLILNYFGQGTYLLTHPLAISNPFYEMIPGWLNWFMVGLATAATIIASQAVISATFSLATQAMALDFLPKFKFLQTSAQQQGQVYVPLINILLAFGTIMLILSFKSSDNLANAYGLAVNLVMFCVTFLVIYVSLGVWRWHWLKTFVIFIPFLFIDLLFFASNIRKVTSGAWIPLMVAISASILMFCWHRGLTYLRNKFFTQELNLASFKKWNNTLAFDAIFLADPYDKTGNIFINLLDLIQQKPRLTLIVNIEIHNVPFVEMKKQFEVVPVADFCYKIIIHYGFKQPINLPLALAQAKKLRILTADLDLDKAIYFSEQPEVVITNKKQSHMYRWQKQVFSLLFYNATTDICYYGLPYKQTITLGNFSEI